mmetsp:Transcript_515/g.1133  ORF Transcript_515/g.1133 Transcript_515/m.1133 type:complete len:563 (+) Transcript_515:1027-2715(+)
MQNFAGAAIVQGRAPIAADARPRFADQRVHRLLRRGRRVLRGERHRTVPRRRGQHVGLPGPRQPFRPRGPEADTGEDGCRHCTLPPHSGQGRAAVALHRLHAPRAREPQLPGGGQEGHLQLGRGPARHKAPHQPRGQRRRARDHRLPVAADEQRLHRRESPRVCPRGGRHRDDSPDRGPAEPRAAQAGNVRPVGPLRAPRGAVHHLPGRDSEAAHPQQPLRVQRDQPHRSVHHGKVGKGRALLGRARQTRDAWAPLPHCGDRGREDGDVGGQLHYQHLLPTLKRDPGTDTGRPRQHHQHPHEGDQPRRDGVDGGGAGGAVPARGGGQRDRRAERNHAHVELHLHLDRRAGRRDRGVCAEEHCKAARLLPGVQHAGRHPPAGAPPEGVAGAPRPREHAQRCPLPRGDLPGRGERPSPAAVGRRAAAHQASWQPGRELFHGPRVGGRRDTDQHRQTGSGLAEHHPPGGGHPQPPVHAVGGLIRDQQGQHPTIGAECHIVPGCDHQGQRYQPEGGAQLVQLLRGGVSQEEGAGPQEQAGHRGRGPAPGGTAAPAKLAEPRLGRAD